MKRRYFPCLFIPAFLLTSCRLLQIFNKTSSSRNQNSSNKEEDVPAFQVSLESIFPKVRLSQSSFFDETVNAITEKEIPPFQEYTFEYFNSVYGFEAIDNENTSSFMGGVVDDQGTVRSLNFYKCTFFIKNASNIVLDYDLRIIITDLKKSNEGASLDDVVRFGLFEEGDLTVWAKKSKTPHLDELGQNDYREAISVSTEEATSMYPFQGYAEMFESERVIATRSRVHLESEETIKYTALIWIEGFDPDNSTNSPSPVGGSMKFSITINDYEAN